MSTIRTTGRSVSGRRTDPFTALAQLDGTFDDLIRRSFGVGVGVGAGPAARLRTGFVPAVDMEVSGRDVLIRLELPGVDVDRDVSLEVDRGRLVVSGHRSERATRRAAEDGPTDGADDRTEDRTGVLVREHRYGSFRREFALPEGTDPADVTAHYDAGILEVRLEGVLRPDPQPVRVPVQVRGAATAAPTIEAETIEHERSAGPGGSQAG